MKINSKLKNLGMFTIAISLDILQTCYQGEYESFFRSYAHDIILPLMNFFSVGLYGRRI